jgi:type I restriction enzyme S subunit
MTEWRTKTVGEIADTQLGKMLNKGKQTGEHTIPYLRSVNVQWGRVDTSDLNQMDIFPNELEKFTVKKGDLLICEGGESGRVAIWDRDEPIGFQNALHRVRAKAEVSNKYLYYYFEWLVKNQLIEHLFNGVTIKHFPQENLRSVEVSYPPIDEQHKIVELLEDHLSRLDAALADLKQAKIKAAQFRSSILQSAFNRGLATEHNKSAWTTAQLSELVDIGWGDLQVTKKSYVQTGYLAYSATGADGFLPYFDYDSEGIIVSAIGANCGKIFRANGKWSCIKNTMRILPKSPSVLLDYLFHYLSDSSIFPKRGSGQPFIGQQDAREIEISFPSIAEQKKIIEFVEYSISRLDSSMKLAEEMEIQSTGLRRSLLQAAFTGQLTKEVAIV